MRTADLFQMAFRALLTNKSRSALTMLGIVIGVGSVLLMMSLGKGAEGLILGQIAGLGAKAIFVEPGPGDHNGPPIGFRMDVLTTGDVEAISRLPSVAKVSPLLYAAAQRVAWRDQDEQADVPGGNRDAFALNSSEVADGRLFEEPEVKAAAHVAVLGSEIAEKLFGSESPLGETIKVAGRVSATVIGVLQPQGSRFFQNLDNRVYLPWPLVQRQILGITYVNFIAAEASGDVETAVDDMRQLLRERHRLDNPTGDLSKDDFAVRTQREAADILGTVSIALTVFLSAIAAISLVVGGIGIMNIMLVSVTERTREIGLRKAVGARERDILWQFLIEAVALTVSGGVIGILTGAGLSFIGSLAARRFVDGWQFTVPLNAVLLGVGVALAVGLAFGIYPAKKAADLNPMEALRYE